MGRGARWVVARLDRAVGAVERNLRTVYGSAQIDPRQMGTQARRSTDRMDGVAGRYEVRRDSAGQTYVVRTPDEAP